MNKYFLIFLALVAVFFIYSFLESKSIEQTKTEISNIQIPKSFNDFKIVFISDLHKRIHTEPNKIKKVIEKVNAQNPDIILLGGDYINYSLKETKIFSELSGLKAKYGVYGVYGNHDTWIGEDVLKKYFQENNIKDLNNNSYWIEKDGEKIKIGGIGDLWTSKQDLSGTIKDVIESDYSILVSHNPDYIEEIKTENKIDLVLSGHTHGGQITVFGLLQPLNPSRYGYLKGLYKFDNKELFITRGIGEFFGPFRFFSRPEISELILKSK